MTDRPVAIVTGASRGIGRGIAEQLGRTGYAVVVNFLRSSAEAQGVAEGIRAAGGAALTVGGDVGNGADRARLIDVTLQEFGRLDLLVNNAGITSVGRRDVLEATEESWDRVLDTNLKGPFFLSQAAANVMIGLLGQQAIPRGILVNVSSISAYAVSTNRADYCLAKAALSTMTAIFAARLAEFPIRVYEVCPGIVASDMTAPVREKYDRSIAEGLTPIRRWGTPADVAKVVAALTTDAFEFSTGQCFHVDGGFHIRRL